MKEGVGELYFSRRWQEMGIVKSGLQEKSVGMDDAMVYTKITES